MRKTLAILMLALITATSPATAGGEIGGAPCCTPSDKGKSIPDSAILRSETSPATPAQLRSALYSVKCPDCRHGCSANAFKALCAYEVPAK